MLTYIHQSNTIIIVLHEIYGINRHIIDVCEKFSKYGIDSLAPNLLNGRAAFSYEQETIAYNYFMGSIGFESAFNQVKEVLQNARANYQKIYVVGYSVGATLAWLCSETDLCDLVIGFYGSRVRSYLAIEPKCPVLLFFPAEEKAFDVDDLISRLNNFDDVQVEKLYGKHGFADSFSRNYNKQSSVKACKQCRVFIQKNVE